MRTSASTTLMVLFTAVLTACATQAPVTSTPPPTTASTPAPSKAAVHPGDKIGNMTIDNEESKHYYWLFDACSFDWELIEPSSQTVECTIPELTEVGIGPVWGAETSKFESSLEPMTLDLSVDGNRVALEEFSYLDLSYFEPSAGFDVTFRNWNVLLRNLSAGAHTFRFSYTFASAINDGWNTYPPGKYEYVADLTVTKKPEYPTLPTTPEPGQHAYTSKDHDLDFLLYVPESYGADPGKKWPMIVYLHDAEWRGSLDFLVKESLPKRLQTLKDFDFIVFSPGGHGGMDFWSKEDMILPVLRALDETIANYSVDAERIYLTGAGMGGNGVWVMGMRNPERFAALAPLGGYTYPFGVPEGVCNLAGVPVWAFHGAEDFMVPAQVEEDLVDALNACGGSAQMTVKTRAVIPLDVYYGPELFKWLLAQPQQ